MTILTVLNGAAIVALVALSFQIWGGGRPKQNKPTIRLVYRSVAAVCGTMIVINIYLVPYALVAALAGAAIGIALTTLGNWAR